MKLYVDGHKVDTGTLHDGKAVLTFTPAKAGRHRVVVRYVGDGNYLRGKSEVAHYRAR